MITTPNRLEGVVEALENGEPVDYRRIAILQTLDLVIVGRKFVEDSAKLQEEEDERIRQLFQR